MFITNCLQLCIFLKLAWNIFFISYPWKLFKHSLRLEYIFFTINNFFCLSKKIIVLAREKSWSRTYFAAALVKGGVARTDKIWKESLAKRIPFDEQFTCPCNEEQDQVLNRFRDTLSYLEKIDFKFKVRLIMSFCWTTFRCQKKINTVKPANDFLSLVYAISL